MGNAIAPRSTFLKLIQQFNKRCLVKHALNIQKDVMETREMQNDGHDHDKIVKWLFQINDDLKHFCQDADKFSIHDIAKKHPTKSQDLYPVEVLGQGLWQTQWQRRFHSLCARISYICGAEADSNYKQKQKDKSQSNNENQNNLLDKEKEKWDSTPCRKHDGAHQWKDCPENWHNKNYHANANDTSDTPNASSFWSKSNKGKVKSMESGATHLELKTLIIRFQDDIDQVSNQLQAVRLHEES